jgi:hypothetical protein
MESSMLVDLIGHTARRSAASLPAALAAVGLFICPADARDRSPSGVDTTVTLSGTRTTLTVEPKRFGADKSVRLTAVTIRTSGPSALQPSGRVEFFLDGAPVGTRLIDWSVARNPIAVGA